METGKALAIFFDIESNEFDEKEKAFAIKKVLTMATHNGVPKAKMLEVINWLWNQRYELIEEE